MNLVLNHDRDDLAGRKALITAKEIQNQPEVWKKLAQTLRQRQGELREFMDRVMAVKGLRVIFTGAGSSAFIGESMSMMLMQELGIRSETHHTTDIVATPEAIFCDVPTLLVSFSRSGSSPESCAAILGAQKYVKELYNLVLVCNNDSALARLPLESSMSKVVNIPQEACDQGFAMTCSVSCMALATWCLFSGSQMDSRIAYLDTLADRAAAQMPAMQEKAAEIAAWDYRRIVYLGFGALRGLAREGAIKSQELTNGYVCAAYDTPTGFRHGPKTVLNDETLTVMMTSPLALAGLYDYDMIRELTSQKAGNRVAVVTDAAKGYDLSAADYVFAYETPDDFAGSEINAYIFSLLFLQILSFEKSYALGMTTDNPCPNGEVNRVVQGIIIHDEKEARKA